MNILKADGRIFLTLECIGAPFSFQSLHSLATKPSESSLHCLIAPPHDVLWDRFVP